VNLRTLSVWLFWLSIYGLTTLFLYSVSERPDVRVSHGVLMYLVLIIVASRHGGRLLSLAMVALSYLSVDLLFVPPRFTFGATNGLDWFVLLGFLATGWLISELFAKQRAATQVAEERAADVERLSRERLALEKDASMANVLREADRLKNALLHSVAHDLRTPVSTLSLLADPASGFTSQVALQRVAEEAARLGEFIGTLQRFANEGGGAMLAAERQSVEQLVQTAVRSSQGVLGGRTVRVPRLDDTLTVQCDFTLSLQVLGNLLQNAARYSPPTAPIEIMVSDTTTMVDIVVADRGPGLSDEERQRLFAPLRRRPRDGKENGQDARLGMGLAIARTFARAQHGDLLHRPRDGGGSEFVVRLPRPPQPQLAAT
jgi:K+-sensing histidine kinase KdpD